MKDKRKTGNRRNQLLWFTSFVILFVFFATALTITETSQSDFVSGTLTNISYNSSGGYLHLYQKEIGVEFNNSDLDYDNSLQGLWHLDDSPIDSSGNGYDGTNNGATANVTGQIDDAYDFDGTNDYVSMGDVLDITGELTFGGWFNSDGTPVTNAEGIFSKYCSHVSCGGTNQRSYDISLTTGDKLQFALSSTGAFESDEVILSTSNITSNQWYHVVAVFKPSSEQLLYVNGVLETNKSTSVISSIYSSSSIFMIGASFNPTAVTQVFDGTIDEGFVYNRSLSSTEIAKLYEQQKGNYSTGNFLSSIKVNESSSTWNINYTQTDLTNFTYLPNSTSTEYACYPNGCSFTGVDNLTYKAYFNSSSKLYNVTIETTAPAVAPSVTNISLFGVHDTVADYSFSSTSYTQGFSTQFNSSENTSYVLMGSFNVEKTGGTTPADIDLLIQVDGVNVSETTVRTIGSLNDQGSIGVIANFSLNNGAHNITTFWKSSTIGNINVDDIDWSIGKLEANNMGQINASINDLNFSFTSTSLAQVYNFTVQKSAGNLSTYYVLNAYLTTATNTPNVICRVGNGSYFSRDLSVGNVASASIGYISDSEGTHTESIWCSADSSDTVTITGKLVEFSLGDSSNNTVQGYEVGNSTSNGTSGYTLTAGTYVLARQQATMRNGTSMFTTASVSFESDSGAQTPTIFVNATEPNNLCYSKKERDFSSSNNIGNAYIYHMCRNLTVGSTYNFTLGIIVPAGETVTVYDEGMQLFEVEPFDITSVAAPSGSISSVTITLPATGTVSTAFDLDISYNCTNSNCVDVWRTIDITPVTGCTIQSGSLVELQANFSNNDTESVSFACTTANTYSFNVTVNSSTGTSFSANDTIVISASAGLTDEESSCLLYGTFVNGTKCNLGRDAGQMTLGIVFFSISLIIIGLYLLLRKKNV